MTRWRTPSHHDLSNKGVFTPLKSRGGGRGQRSLRPLRSRGGGGYVPRHARGGPPGKHFLVSLSQFEGGLHFCLNNLGSSKLRYCWKINNNFFLTPFKLKYEVEDSVRLGRAKRLLCSSWGALQNILRAQLSITFAQKVLQKIIIVETIKNRCLSHIFKIEFCGWRQSPAWSKLKVNLFPVWCSTKKPIGSTLHEIKLQNQSRTDVL